MAAANLALRFLLEVAGFIGAGYVAYGLADGLTGVVRAVLAVLAVLLVIGIWGFVVAPRRRNGLSQAQKDTIGTLLLLLIAAGMAVTGAHPLALAFAALVVVNGGLLFVFGQDARQRLEGTAGHRRR